MAKEFMGTLVFLYEASEKTKSLQPALRSVRKICEEGSACITDWVKGRQEGRLGMLMTIKSQRRFERKDQCESWIETLKSRLSTELSPHGQLSHWHTGCVTAPEKELIGEAMAAFSAAYRRVQKEERTKARMKCSGR